MRAYLNSTGLTVRVNGEEALEKKIDCILNDGNYPTVILHKRKNVESAGIEEPGFHIQGFPKDKCLSECSKIHIYLDKKRWYQVFFGYDEEFSGGFLLSRSKYDRIDIGYYADRKKKCDNIMPSSE